MRNIILFIVFLLIPLSANSAVFTVNTTADTIDINPGDGICSSDTHRCSLRAAIMESNAYSTMDTIVLASTTTYPLSLPGADATSSTPAAQSDLDITDSVIIRSLSQSTISGGKNESRIFHVYGAGTELKLENITLTNGRIDNIGGCILVDGAKLRLEVGNSIVTNCTSGTDSGGAIGLIRNADLIVENSASLNINNSESSFNGGCLYSDDSNTFVRGNINFSNCKSDQQGGAMSLENHSRFTTGHSGATAILEYSEAADEGGCLYLNQSDFYVVKGNSNFNHCTSADDGGAASLSDASSLFISNLASGIFSDNSSQGAGGAINLSSDLNYLFIFNSTFDNNNSLNSSGGAINTGSSSHTRVENSFFNSNTSAIIGGAIVHHGEYLYLSNTEFSNNTSIVGGAICNHGTGFEVYNSKFLTNTASTAGGLHLYNATTTRDIVSNTIFDGNVATFIGGAVVFDSNSATIKNSLIENNSARISGALGNQYSTTATLDIVNSTLTNNTHDSTRTGGVIHLEEPNKTINFYNSTLYNNSINTSTSNSIKVDQSTITLTNTIFAEDSPNRVCSIDSTAGGQIISNGYNLISDLNGCNVTRHTTDLYGNSLLTSILDPELLPLANNGGPTETHALSPSSPAVDAGDPGFCKDKFGTKILFDQRGTIYMRHKDGDSDGTRICDIGAFEL